MTIIKIVFLVFILTMGFVIGFSIPDHQQITSYASYAPDYVRLMLEEQTVVYSRLSRDYTEALDLKNYMQETVLDGKAYDLTGDAYIRVFKNLPREGWYSGLNEDLASRLSNPELTSLVTELKYLLIGYDDYEGSDDLMRLQFKLLEITKEIPVNCLYDYECDDNNMATQDLCVSKVCFNMEQLSYGCADSDNGKNFTQAGRVFLANISGYFGFVDSCASGNTLSEYYCSNNQPVKVEIECSCLNGACV